MKNYTTMYNPNTSESVEIELIQTIQDGKNTVWIGKANGLRQRFYRQDGWRTAGDKPATREGGRFAVTTAATVNRRQEQRQRNYDEVLAMG